MEAKQFLTANYIDIIYDQRNKAYGGYELRKNYNRRLGKSAAIIALSLLLLTSVMLPGANKATPIYTRNTPTQPTDVNMPDAEKKMKTPHTKATEPPHTTTPRPMHTKLFTEPVPTRGEIPPELQPAATNAPALPGPKNSDGDGAGISPTGDMQGKTGVVDESHNAISKEPLAWVAQMPSFDGDMSAFIGGHIHYPETAQEAGVSGQVLVRFVVNEDGSVSDVTVIRGIGGGCDEEAMKMVRSMPKWKPGRQNGIAVKVYFTLPITFVLQQ